MHSLFEVADSMTLLALCIFLFGVVHLNPAIPAWRDHAKQTFGNAYGPVYGVVSLLLLAACLWAFRGADIQPLYEAPVWGRHANFALTLIGFICIGIFLFRGSWRNRLKYPMAIGISIWASGHLIANGDTRTTLLFCGLGVFAILHAILKASSGPFVPSEVRNGHNLLSVLAGVALYGLAVQLHVVFAGVPVVTLQ
jgi:uncharacterized membrane protein